MMGEGGNGGEGEWVVRGGEGSVLCAFFVKFIFLSIRSILSR